MNELALFAGAGGGILAGHLLGWRTVCAVERDAYAAQVLAQRQNDGILPTFPIWSDVCSFDGKPWNGIIDVISGGFPCQDISSAGKGAGIDGDRSGLWAEMARIIGEVRPTFVFVENSPMLVSRGLTRVVGDLAKMGYDAHWARLSASNFGAPHIRDRLWIVANANSERFAFKDITSGLQKKVTWSGNYDSQMANANSFGFEQMEQRITPGETNQGAPSQIKHSGFTRRWKWWSTEPRLGRVADGVANRVDRLKATGNGQVSEVARSAFEFLRSI